LEKSGSNSGGSSGGSSRSSGSGGGGGAGGSPEPQSNVAAKEISQTFVTSGNPARFDFPRNATSIAYISFNSKKTAGKTTTIVEMLKGKSTLVIGLPSGEVYKSLNIWVGNGGFATPSNIENSVICFKVEKSWTQDKNITHSSINLYRYNDKKWNQLQTSLLREDDKCLYFTAQTPGFSPFAIAGISITNGTAIQPGLSNQNIELNNTKSEAEQKSEKEKNANLPVFGMVCMIALLLVAFLFKIEKQ
jgi:PGF-pre-PGF domain-containing protein